MQFSSHRNVSGQMKISNRGQTNLVPNMHDSYYYNVIYPPSGTEARIKCVLLETTMSCHEPCVEKQDLPM